MPRKTAPELARERIGEGAIDAMKAAMKHWNIKPHDLKPPFDKLMQQVLDAEKVH